MILILYTLEFHTKFEKEEGLKNTDMIYRGLIFFTSANFLEPLYGFAFKLILNTWQDC